MKNKTALYIALGFWAAAIALTVAELIIRGLVQ